MFRFASVAYKYNPHDPSYASFIDKPYHYQSEYHRSSTIGLYPFMNTASPNDTARPPDDTSPSSHNTFIRHDDDLDEPEFSRLYGAQVELAAARRDQELRSWTQHRVRHSVRSQSISSRHNAVPSAGVSNRPSSA